MKLLQKVTSLVVTAAMVAGLGSNLLAAKDKVAIDAKHFPDPGFREFVSVNYDRNSDGILSIQEAECALVVKIIEDDSIKSLKGIEYLAFVKELYVQYCDIDDVDLSDNFNLTKIQFVGVTGMENLTPGIITSDISVSECQNLKYINFEDSDYLYNLMLTSNPKLQGDIDLTASHYVKNVLMTKNPMVNNVIINKADKDKLEIYMFDDIKGKVIYK